jgi:type III secretion system low calcium response chaperone LcrH/SycD
MTIQSQVLEMIESTKSMTQNLKNFTSDELETLYISAYQFYQQEMYDKATEIFFQLTTSHPFEEAFWKGLASCYQMQNLFDEALHAFALASLLNDKDPYYHYHAAECLFAKKEMEDAKKALTKAQERLGPSDDDIKNRITLLQQLISGG